VLEESPLAKKGTRHDEQLWLSWYKAAFIRRRVQEAIRERGISGYVVTGWRDTPISAAGLVDDWGKPRLEQFLERYDGETDAFLVSFRKPPWICGGNRPGWSDPYNHFEGPVTVQVGLHSSRPRRGTLKWEVCKLEFTKGERPLRTIAEGALGLSLRALEAQVLEPITWRPDGPGRYILFVRQGRFETGFHLHVFAKPGPPVGDSWSCEGRSPLFAGFPFGGGHNVCATSLNDELLDAIVAGNMGCLFLTDQATRPAPFWREASYESELGSSGRYWSSVPEKREPLAWFSDIWEVRLPVSPDRVIDLDALYSHLPKNAEIRTLINRIDTRTYKEAPIMVEARCGKGRMLATTLRPYGGLGCQPYGVMNNPAGAALLESMMRYLEQT
jgi:hypothetical protein